MGYLRENEIKSDYKQTCALILEGSNSITDSPGNLYYSSKKLMFCKIDSSEINNKPPVKKLTKEIERNSFTLLLFN